MSNPHIERVMHGETVLAVIVRSSFSAEKTVFLVPEEFPHQLGYIHGPKEHVIVPHEHQPVTRTITGTQETLLLRKGKMRVDFYAPGTDILVEKRVLEPGDVVLLASGGHGMTMLEDCEILEVKQGPYARDLDKKRFKPGW